MASNTILVNRAPVLTLWAAIVAQRLGYDHETALTLGKAVAGLNAQSKGRRLGIFGDPEKKTPAKKTKTPAKPAADTVLLLGRTIPVVETPEGLRAVVKERAESPSSVERYLEQKFGSAKSEVAEAMQRLAKSYPPKQLEKIAFSLYEEFRPTIPEGTRGWGAKGRLDPSRIRSLAKHD